MNTDSINTKMKLSPPTLQPWVGGEDNNKDIIVLMSGGVDSSVTALLLKQAGWNVLGITMKIPLAKKCDVHRSCCGMEAAYLCKDLGIPHYYLDIRDAFQRLVVEPFRESYARGETPSPCIDCNTLFKFSLVWDFVEEAFGVENLATGHYARVVHSESGARLARANDLHKDQTYFLYGIPRRRLGHLHLPLGDYTKEEVRELAREARLPVARRPESMELCFAGEGDYRNALGETAARKGPILDTSGNVIGEHDGIEYFTVGQRRGLRVAMGKPLYVIGIDPVKNAVIAGSWDDALRSDVSAREVNVLIPEALHAGARLFGKIRSQGNPSACAVRETSEDGISVVFDEPQFAPTPGQRLVIYDADGNVVAGGTIVPREGREQ
ncbi:MAG: tRNA 2-thiouridine(34) synthase MnmA [Armatimonadota bacterium]|nr:tRNA 2-thiouridine(34) synthase MnmA [bacterium]